MIVNVNPSPKQIPDSTNILNKVIITLPAVGSLITLIMGNTRLEYNPQYRNSVDNRNVINLDNLNRFLIGSSCRFSILFIFLF